MHRHFTNFTKEAMGALRESMVAGREARLSSLEGLRQSLASHLSASKAARFRAEEERQTVAVHDRGSRQMFMSGLTTAVQTLKAETRALKAEMAADRRVLAAELEEAQRAFRGTADPARAKGKKH